MSAAAVRGAGKRLGGLTTFVGACLLILEGGGKVSNCFENKEGTPEPLDYYRALAARAFAARCATVRLAS